MPGSATITAFSGQTPPWSLASLDANFTSINALLKDVGNYEAYVADSGAANAYVVTFAASLTFSLAAGVPVVFKASAANTGASTLNANATGARSIKNVDGTALAAGQIAANGIYKVIYDGTQYLLLNPTQGVIKGGGSTTGTFTVGTQLTVSGTGTSSIAGLLDLSAATAGQIKFPATQNPSSDVNTLDDYERGTWTISFTFATPNDLAVSAETKEAYYVKIGQQVFLFWNYTFTPTFTTSAGNAQLTGMPFTHKDVTNANCVGRGTIRHNANLTYPAGATMCYPSGTDNATLMLIQTQGSGTGAAAVTTARITSAVSTDLHGSLTYQATA
jgi:hypothetical protein